MMGVSWELIWLCEHAFKEEHIARCERLCSALHLQGGRLKRVTNALDLLQPYLKPQLANWAIIADWRETEALAEVLWSGNQTATLPFGPPMFTIVECENHMQLSQASFLAEKVKDHVHIIIMPVCHENILGTCLNGIIKKYVSNFQRKLADVKVDHQKQQFEQMEVNIGEQIKPLLTNEGVREHQEEASVACRTTAAEFVAFEQSFKMNLRRVDKPSVSEHDNHRVGISEQRRKIKLKEILLQFGMPLQTLGEPSAPQLEVNDDAESS